MPHTVTIAPYASTNNYGEDVTGATRTAKAYVEPMKIIQFGDQVNEEVRTTTAYINDLNITVRDTITLPDGSTPTIVSIAKHDEVAGLEHTEVVFR